jgi:hypothetical protein
MLVDSHGALAGREPAWRAVLACSNKAAWSITADTVFMIACSFTYQKLIRAEKAAHWIGLAGWESHCSDGEVRTPARGRCWGSGETSRTGPEPRGFTALEIRQPWAPMAWALVSGDARRGNGSGLRMRAGRLRPPFAEFFRGSRLAEAVPERCFPQRRVIE